MSKLHYTNNDSICKLNFISVLFHIIFLRLSWLLYKTHFFIRQTFLYQCCTTAKNSCWIYLYQQFYIFNTCLKLKGTILLKSTWSIDLWLTLTYNYTQLRTSKYHRQMLLIAPKEVWTLTVLDVYTVGFSRPSDECNVCIICKSW